MAIRSRDRNGDGTISLTDVVLGLQVVTGQEPSESVTSNADINGDGKIGIEEVMHALQQRAGEQSE